MRRVFGTALVCISAVLFFLAAAFADGWDRQSFKDLGFSVSRPAGWEMRKLTVGETGEIVAIILPKNAGRSGFKANIVITSSVPEDASVPLENLYRMNISSMASSPEFPGFEQLNSYNIKLGERDAFQTTFTYSHPKLGIKLKSFQVYVMSGGRLFIIQYAAPNLTYKKYMNEVNEIVRSFEPGA